MTDHSPCRLTSPIPTSCHTPRTRPAGGSLGLEVALSYRWNGSWLEYYPQNRTASLRFRTTPARLFDNIQSHLVNHTSICLSLCASASNLPSIMSNLLTWLYFVWPCSWISFLCCHIGWTFTAVSCAAPIFMARSRIPKMSSETRIRYKNRDPGSHNTFPCS